MGRSQWAFGAAVAAFGLSFWLLTAQLDALYTAVPDVDASPQSERLSTAYAILAMSHLVLAVGVAVLVYISITRRAER
ncbi:MAG: hypothetical protein J0H54_05600 [Rhizobiales bacterium]|nr:hypothetical protein [Hyphomicrobiales bacterium]